MSGSEENGMGSEDALLRAARKLPLEIAPRHDLWPGIEAAISPRSGRQGWRWNRLLAQAAAVLLLVGGSSGVTWFVLENRGAVSVPPDEAAGSLTFDTVAGSIGSRYHLGPDFVDARADLASDLEEKLGALPPETRTAVERNIADIRASIAEINRALAEEPDNTLLQELLLNSYREELTLMKKVDSVARAAMYRADI